MLADCDNIRSDSKHLFLHKGKQGNEQSYRVLVELGFLQQAKSPQHQGKHRTDCKLWAKNVCQDWCYTSCILSIADTQYEPE